MKKFLIFCFICTLLLTGCGSKKLTCTIEENEEGIKMNQKIVLTFDSKGDFIKKGTFTSEIEFSEEYNEYLDELEESLNSEYEDIKDIAEVKTSLKGNKYSVKINYNTSNLNDDQKDELYYADIYADTNYEETKTDLETTGYTCK